MEYTADYEARDAKVVEIEAALDEIANVRSEMAASELRQVVRNAIQITPPFDPPLVLRHITFDLQSMQGQSRKPGNIVFNWKSLLEVGPDTAFAMASALDRSWLVPFAAIYVLKKVWNAATVDLQERDGLVLMGLWNPPRSPISEEEARRQCNTVANKYGRDSFGEPEFAQSITRLTALRCLGNKAGNISLIERVLVRY